MGGYKTHLVETAPSVLRKMPWVVLKEHKVGIRWEQGNSEGGKEMVVSVLSNLRERSQEQSSLLPCLNAE